MACPGGYDHVVGSDSEPARGPSAAPWRRPVARAAATLFAAAVAAQGVMLARRRWAVSAAEPDGGAVQLAGHAMKPRELLHGGRPCDPREELFEGLCYQRCALLTAGEAPIRTSAWTCCESHPCTPFNERGEVGLSIMCTGYDVGGDGRCPHEPGACLIDEELYGGVCYNSCALLTHGTLPNRVGPATCCDVHGFGCLRPGHSETMDRFAVGGGGGEEPATLAEAHLPVEGSSEEQPAESTERPVERRRGKPVERRQERRKEGASQNATGAEVAAPRPAPSGTCGSDEELYGGRCYRRCGLLTDGKAAIRTSSWTCCTAHPCFPWKQRGAVGKHMLCNGFDVAGDGSCPYKPGACFRDEELYEGVCYKRCRLLTNGAFPHRFAAETCCKEEGLGCLDVQNDRTSESFDVGGATGDPDPSTPWRAHTPLQVPREEPRLEDEIQMKALLVPRRLRASLG